MENIVHAAFFERPCYKETFLCKVFAYLAKGYLMIRPAFQMGMDFAVNSQRYIVPAKIAGVLTMCAVVEFHVEQGIRFQPLFQSDRVIFLLLFSERFKGSFLCEPYDFRVIPYQGLIDTFTLDFEGFSFRGTEITNKQGCAVAKTDRYITGTPPLAGAERAFYLARFAVKGLRDDSQPFFHGQIFVLLGNFYSFFLQICKVLISRGVLFLFRFLLRSWDFFGLR